MKLVVLLAFLAAACGSASPTPSSDGSAGASGNGGGGGSGGGYSTCPQHRVEGPECPSATSPDGVLHKDGRICATCIGRDATGNLTPQPIGCTTIAGDLCVADCGECS
jgi:hypothetical protein